MVAFAYYGKMGSEFMDEKELIQTIKELIEPLETRLDSMEAKIDRIKYEVKNLQIYLSSLDYDMREIKLEIENNIILDKLTKV